MSVTAVVWFLGAVSVFFALAAWVGDAGLRRLRLPTRWAWLGAMAGPFVLLAAAAMPEAPTTSAASLPVVELAPLVVGPDGGGWLALDPVVGVVWSALSGALLLLLLWTHLGLSRERARWQRTEVLGRPVYVSDDRGPAVAGVVRPWIVLPRWVLSLPEPELGLVLLHEEEHVRAGDTVLLSLALALVVTAPWNPVTWWQLRRLRTAMEMDCDRRVLRREPDRRRYGRSLLSVAERVTGPSLGLASFTERPLSLERRLTAMTSKRSRWTPVTAGLLVLLAVVVGVQACAIEVNIVTDRDDDQAVDERTTEVYVGAEEAAPPADPASPAAPATSRPQADEAGGADGPAGEEVVPPPPPPEAEIEPTEPPLAPEATEPVEEPAERDVAAGPTFTPFTVAPSILNRREVVEAMEGAYPPLLREAGIGGTIRIYFFINQEGRVEDFRIDQSSGHPALDDAALRVAEVYRFSPALNRDKQVPVWVSFPITFQVR